MQRLSVQRQALPAVTSPSPVFSSLTTEAEHPNFRKLYLHPSQSLTDKETDSKSFRRTIYSTISVRMLFSNELCFDAKAVIWVGGL
jgi:hypothetical protein